MNAPELFNSNREIARGLGAALEPVLEAQVSTLNLHAARDVAQLLSLPGLERLLGVLEPHAGRPWPPEVVPAIERLRRVVRRAEAESDVAAFRRDDGELGALAAGIEALEWAGGEPGAGPVHTVRIEDALADLAYTPAAGEALRAARLSAPAAAALRAAVDWVSGAGGPSRPLELTLEDDVLEVRCVVSDPAGLKAAHSVLGPVGGQIARRAAESTESGRWMVRVPLVTARPRYLMIVQGGASLAMPWSAVMRVLMVPEAEIERTARAHDAPLLVPVVPLTRAVSERPVVLIASGLLRGFMVADRLIWRLAAEPCDPGQPGPANLDRAVRTEDGEIYWVVDPAKLLAPLPLPALLDVTTTSATPPRREPVSRADIVKPSRAETARAAEAREAGRRAASPATERPPLRVLGSGDVTPIAAPGAPETAPVATAAPVAAPGPDRPRALVIEDSIAARVFLTRMLESRGFAVTAVALADKGLAEVERGPWAIVCGDLELPDASGANWLRTLRARVHPDTPLVALVRDRHDGEIAAAAGLSRLLRKPFDDMEVSAMIERVTGRGRSGA